MTPAFACSRLGCSSVAEASVSGVGLLCGLHLALFRAIDRGRDTPEIRGS